MAASTWNRRLIRERGLAMGREHVGKGVNVALGPMMNMGRVAQGGRNWEGFRADPFLAGEAAYETVLGMQQAGITACAKHFMFNEQEHKRTTTSSFVDSRTTHEIYAHPFLRSVMAGVGSVMCSYNAINSTYACENSPTINALLKSEYGFRGYMMSDWQATLSTFGSVEGGLDMTMPGDITFDSGDSYFGGNLTEYVRNGTIPEERVDDMGGGGTGSPTSSPPTKPSNTMPSSTAPSRLTSLRSQAARKDAALVFINSDSGEDYINFDGNEGDRKNLTAWHNGHTLVQTMTMLGDITFDSGDSYFGGNLTEYVRNGTIPKERVDDLGTGWGWGMGLGGTLDLASWAFGFWFLVFVLGFFFLLEVEVGMGFGLMLSLSSYLDIASWTLELASRENFEEKAMTASNE
ncbi:hypothetical protein D9758_017418 [Tetrapyrgos nigripes]|uniref:beta-glucosidase n=1 Tax=Tetrapyrgos nigripes TaxID=182062 RepID=A0A8H5FEN6_9AGAR|nr:hypothetical protein D9758_017418 [Tetrapyrgos nigripes]